MRFPSRLASDEISTRGYRTLAFIKCTPIMIAELMVMSSQGSSPDEMVLGWEWYDFWCSLCGTV
jgi:hypothetical protein